MCYWKGSKTGMNKPGLEWGVYDEKPVHAIGDYDTISFGICLAWRSNGAAIETYCILIERHRLAAVVIQSYRVTPRYLERLQVFCLLGCHCSVCFI